MDTFKVINNGTVNWLKTGNECFFSADYISTVGAKEKNIPFSEIETLQKDEGVGKNVFFTLSLSDNTYFRGQANIQDYTKLYVNYTASASPQYIKLPTKKVVKGIKKELIIICSFLFLVVILFSGKGSDASKAKTATAKEQNLANNSEFVGLAKALIIGNGYLCYDLHKVIQRGWDGSYYVVCDNYTRQYIIKENVNTGNWIVTPE
ncbi:MAG: hypothetical protein ACJAYB_003130 [Psychromonas sp.]